MFLVRPWSALINPFFISRRGIFRGVKRHAKNIAGNVLDFGCGSKPYENLFTSCSSYIGLDIESSNHNHENSKVDIFYDGKLLPFANNAFDAVVSFQVFQHIFNLNEMLLEISRVIKPGGTLLISAPLTWDEHEQPHDFSRFTSFGIQRLLVEAGYEIQSIKKTTTYIETIGQLLAAYVTQHLGPKNLVGAAIFQLIFVSPITLFTVLANAVLPKKDELYCDQIVLARKK